MKQIFKLQISVDINEGTEWSKIFIRAVFWHYECKKRFLFAKFKNFEKWPNVLFCYGAEIAYECTQFSIFQRHFSSFFSKKKS